MKYETKITQEEINKLLPKVDLKSLPQTKLIKAIKTKCLIEKLSNEAI